MPGIKPFFSYWKPYKIAFNLLSLVFALFFSLIFLVVVLLPSFSSQIGRFTVDQYVAYYHTKEQQALQAGSKGNLTLLASILSNYYSDIQKGDRVYPQKRKLLLQLCANLYAEQRYSELLSWATNWFQLDQRDVTAMAYYYQALWLVEHQDDVLLKLKQASQRFPKHVLLQQFNQVNLGE